MGLTKKDGGLRPISMGETLRRLTGKAAAYQLRERTSVHLRPFQWGVNTSRGCATIAHTARDYLRRHPDHVLLKLDIANAFNSQSRGAFLAAVATSFPEALGRARVCQRSSRRFVRAAPRLRREAHARDRALDQAVPRSFSAPPA